MTPDGGNDRRFGRFQILRTLGQGGFGIVFLAWDPALRRQVALKVPQPEALMTPEARKRFQREAQAAAGLDHTNIVPVYESGNVGSVTYIAAAYCSGPTLADWLRAATAAGAAARRRYAYRRACGGRRARPRAGRAPPRFETQQYTPPARGGGRSRPMTRTNLLAPSSRA